jgi:hypothetical protein
MPKQIVGKQVSLSRKGRVRLSTVAHASPGLSLLFPLFFLAPFAVFFGPLGN